MVQGNGEEQAGMTKDEIILAIVAIISSGIMVICTLVWSGMWRVQ